MSVVLTRIKIHKTLNAQNVAVTSTPSLLFSLSFTPLSLTVHLQPTRTIATGRLAAATDCVFSSPRQPPTADPTPPSKGSSSCVCFS